MAQPTIPLLSPSSRIKLTTPSAEEDEALSVLRSHPISLRYLRFMPQHISTSEVKQRRENRAKDPRVFDLHAYLLDNGVWNFIGVAGVHNIDETNSSCEAGILVSPDFHRKGVSTEILYTLLQHVFEVKNFHRITFETGVDNVPMRGWLEKVAGAQLEGRRKECWKDFDGWTDVMSYAILDWEWRDRIEANLRERLEKRAGNFAGQTGMGL